MSDKEHPNVIRESDQWRCTKCRRVWDANDPEPPPCEPDEAQGETDKVRKRRK